MLLVAMVEQASAVVIIPMAEILQFMVVILQQLAVLVMALGLALASAEVIQHQMLCGCIDIFKLRITIRM